MSLKDIALTTDATLSVAPGAGTVVLKKDSVMISNGAHFVFAGDTNPGTRRSITVKHRAPQVNPKTGRFGKSKHEMSVIMPELSIDNVAEFPLIRVTIENSPNTTDPESTMEKLISIAFQMLVASAGEDWRKYGTPE